MKILHLLIFARITQKSKEEKKKKIFKPPNVQSKKSWVEKVELLKSALSMN